MADFGQMPEKQGEIDAAVLQGGEQVGNQGIIAAFGVLQTEFPAHFVQIGRLKNIGPLFERLIDKLFGHKAFKAVGQCGKFQCAI